MPVTEKRFPRLDAGTAGTGNYGEKGRGYLLSL